MRLFFAALKFISLKDFKDDETIELVPGLIITQSQKIKRTILTEKNRAIIGVIESSFIQQNNVLLYYKYQDNDELFKDLPNLKILENILMWIDDILKNSWLIKDNSIVCDTAFMIHQKNGKTEASTLRLQYLFTKASGAIDNVEFTKEEINNFIEYHDKIEMYLHSKGSGSFNFMLYKNFSRIGRALLFVKQAREARNLAYKISNYCSALETLFSTDSAELSHKLSERTAFFLSKEFNKIDTYKTVKKAYSIRSKLTHGDCLEQKQIDLLEGISTNIDNILRVIFNKILIDDNLLDVFDSNNNKIDAHFESLIFE